MMNIAMLSALLTLHETVKRFQHFTVCRFYASVTPSYHTFRRFASLLRKIFPEFFDADFIRKSRRPDLRRAAFPASREFLRKFPFSFAPLHGIISPARNTELSEPGKRLTISRFHKHTKRGLI